MGVPADPTCSGRGAGYSLLRWRRVGVCRASHQPEVMPRGQGDRVQVHVRACVCVCVCVRVGAVGWRTGEEGGSDAALFSSVQFRAAGRGRGHETTGICGRTSKQRSKRQPHKRAGKRVKRNISAGACVGAGDRNRWCHGCRFDHQLSRDAETEGVGIKQTRLLQRVS